MNSTRYFPHDFGARNDPKLINLQMEMGGTGIGLYWCIIEMIWEQGGYLGASYRNIAYMIRWATEDEVRRVIEDFDLFKHEGNLIWSPSLLSRMDAIEDMSTKRREAGRKGGFAKKANSNTAVNEESSSSAEANLDESCSNAIAMPKQNPSNAIAMPQQCCSNKINKIKEKKEIKEINKIKEESSEEDKSSSSSSSCSSFFKEKEKEKEEKEQVFDKFFFDRNMKNASAEVERFWSYYSARGWMWGNTAIVDKISVASQWKPEEKGGKFPKDFIRWLAELRSRVPLPRQLLGSIVKVELNTSGYQCLIRCETKADAENLKYLVEQAGSTKKIGYSYERE